MGIRKFKPVTPGTRFRAQNTYEELTPDYKVEKSLIVSLKNSGGRNNSGKMTMRYIGGGSRKLYRVIDFKRNKFGVEAKVDSIQYDPNRSSFIALLVYTDGEKRYILAPKGLEAGQTVISGTGIAPEIGNALPLSEIPLGTTIHNIEIHPGKGGQMARSAGAGAQLLNRDGKYATVKMV